MKKWMKISGLLCVFGFFHDIRPSEPFITEFLTGPWRNFTQDEVNREVYPVGTYSYLSLLFLVFLITDFLRYKPLIITMGISGIIVWSMLSWTTTLAAMQAVQFFYGVYMATEVAYYTYIYAKVDKKYYPRVTSHTRAAMFTGKLVGAISAQVLTNLEVLDYMQLNYITLSTQIMATLWACALPKVGKSLYFHREEYTIAPWQLLWNHFRSAYTNSKVMQWSIAYSLILCGYLQVISYVQVLWKDIETKPAIAWNGAVDAVLTALAALTAILAGYIHAERLGPRGSLLVLASISMLEGGAILLATWTQIVYVSYVGYIIFGALYGFVITISSAEVARHLEEDSFGLIFGINTLVAVLLQTILTLVVISYSGLALDIRAQYTVYASYFIVIGTAYFIFVLAEYLSFKYKARNAETICEKEEMH